ncbi:hypothetical protein BsWGS_06545 [Bradybaena similaris]
MDNLWQSPYVNTFKHFNLATWKKATKEGEVVSLMDKTVKSTVYRITGSIPAGNFIQLPKTNTQSLGLTGRYFYLLFRLIPSKHFVVHLDVATADNLVIRVSFSNLFKSFKSTSTWLQFPFVCGTPQGSLPPYASDIVKDQSGPAPMITKWTILCLDLQHMLSVYQNRKFIYVKSIRLCANMLVKNVFTSDTLYDPGLTMSDAKRQGLTAHGICPLPRDMSYPVAKGEHWHDLYDWIRFPSDTGHKTFDAIQMSSPKSRGKSAASSVIPPKRIQPRTLDVSKCVSDRVSMIHKLTAPRQPAKYVTVTKDLPEMPLDMSSNYHHEDVHIYAHPEQDIPDMYENETLNGKAKYFKDAFHSSEASPLCKSLEPDPIMKLKQIIGFGGSSFRDALWSVDGSSIVYPCHAVVVSMKISNGQQRFFIGHTDKVSCLAQTASSSLLASGQTGQMSVVRVWKYLSGECLAIGKAHVHSLSCLSFSSKGLLLCGVGKDGHGKNMVVIWNTSRVMKHKEMSVMAKAHTDVDISRILIAPFDDTKMVSCGKDNVRLWRIKEGALRSAPFNLGEYNTMDFTDICFDSSHLDSEVTNKLLYTCTKSGHICELDCNKLSVHHVRRLLPLKNRPKREGKIQYKSESGDALSINSMHLNETFCVTGSDDGFLRLWPLDFAHVYLEAEHEGPVTTSRLSADGLKILAGTSTGNLGILDVPLRQYTTVMRSHASRIHCFAVDPLRKHLTTVSADSTIRVWDIDTLQQLYDFSASEDCPSCINYHPNKQIFACGFQNGSVKVFSVESTCLLAELKQLRGEVTGVVYSLDGSRLYTCCSLGVAAIFDSSTEEYKLVRVITGLVARGNQFGPQALALSPCGRRVAFVGPTEFTVTVADARCLDELLRIDVSDLTVGSSNIDSAERVTFSPAKTDHLLVTTTNNRLIKYDAKDGRLLQETDHIHRTGCSSICVSNNGKYMATGGDKTIKIWDYHLQLDINFQVFIGHSENVCRIHFTPNDLSLISAGEAVYIWDFMAIRAAAAPVEHGMVLHDSDIDEPHSARTDDTGVVRSTHNGNTSHNSDFTESIGKVITFGARVNNGAETVKTFPLVGERDRSTANGHVLRTHNMNADFVQGHNTSTRKRSRLLGRNRLQDQFSQPSAFVHYKQRMKNHGICQRRYTAPPNQSGLKLHSVIGFSCSGRSNMVWQPDTGLFAYSSGCVVVIEDLSSGKQKHLHGHMEEVTCLALQHDSQYLASASPAFEDTPCQICVWDTQTKSCKKVLLKHKFSVQCLAYSRDDRFLVSVGDYREYCIVVWDTTSYQIAATSMAPAPIHCLKWDPFAVNEFVSVGEQGTVLFWLLDETSSEVCLNVHEADLPDELENDGPQGTPVVFTALAYAGDGIVYIGTNSGKVTAWDTQENSCFLQWRADTGEITKLISRHSQLMTAGVGHSLKLWAVSGVGSMKLTGGGLSHSGSGLVMEDEMVLDGAVTSAEFDDTLDMGIVGTAAGTLWYINWSERTSIRLVSGHQNKINGVAFLPNNMMLTGGDDGSVRVWSLENREQAIQFQVQEQACTCLAVGQTDQVQASKMPLVAGGYSDGTVRVFDLSKVEMLLKMHPHAVTVTTLAFSADGIMIISGGSDGLIAVSSPTTGMTVRIIGDHKGVAISNIDVTLSRDLDVGVTAPTLWLASSIDRRVSIWSADWAKDFCELVDWLTFPAPAVMPNGTKIVKNDSSHYYQLPPTLARFSPDDPDTVVYTGYGMEKLVQFYSLTQRKVVRSLKLTHWSLCLDVSPDSALIAVGISERLLKLMDYRTGSFQDFAGHGDGVTMVKFSQDGARLVTVSHGELFLWEVML